MFTKKFERRIYVAATVISSSGLFGFCFLLYALWPTKIVTGYEPNQPIAFSHKLHAGEMQIQCVYCHTGVENGAHATVPPVSTCMNCHKHVHPKDKKGRPSAEITKLKSYWEKKEPILWNKVNDLADFVYFNHSRHISSGVECSECHGKVETMERVRRQNSLKMGWCLECHMQPPKEEETHKKTRAPINCGACHR